MKKSTLTAMLTAIAMTATDYDDFYARIESLEKALGNSWMLTICVEADVIDLNNPQWYTVLVFPPKGKEYEVDLTEYLKGVD